MSRIPVLCLAFLCLVAAGCGAQGAPTPPPPRTVTVFAAASLTEAFTELGEKFAAARPGVRVNFNFAGSQQLRRQLQEGAHADVFASANAGEMDAAVAAGLVADGPEVFARNRLVVIYPADNPRGIETAAGLALGGVRLVLADKAVPVGGYTLEMLDRLSADPAYGPGFKDEVLANVASLEQNVKAVVAKVRLGEADAGVAYASDVWGAAGEGIATLAVPDAFNPVALYPIAALRNAPEPDLAREFVEYVLSPNGQAVLARYGLAL